MADFTPTTEEVREAFVRHMREVGVAAASEYGEEFDRWVARLKETHRQFDPAAEALEDACLDEFDLPTPATYVRVVVQVREGEVLVGHCTHEYEVSPHTPQRQVISDLVDAATHCGRSALWGEPLILPERRA